MEQAICDLNETIDRLHLLTASQEVATASDEGQLPWLRRPFGYGSRPDGTPIEIN